MSQVTIIAAAGQKNELGLNGDLPWHLPDDFKRFKQLTTGHPIIMGRKTFETFPKPLKNRKHLVITRDRNYTTDWPEVEIYHSLEEALLKVASLPLVFVIGGGQIYKQALKYAQCIELTRVHGTFESDTWFPEIGKDWILSGESSHPADERHKLPFTFQTYLRRSQG